jgi:hypothetical protein
MPWEKINLMHNPRLKEKDGSQKTFRQNLPSICWQKTIGKTGTSANKLIDGKSNWAYLS